MNREIWEQRYSTPPKRLPTYDGWLEERLEGFSRRGYKDILDLGCGRGTDSNVLSKHGFTILYTDYVFGTLHFVNKRINVRRGVQADHSAPLPFRDTSFDIVITTCLSTTSQTAFWVRH